MYWNNPFGIPVMYFGGPLPPSLLQRFLIETGVGSMLTEAGCAVAEIQNISNVDCGADTPPGKVSNSLSNNPVVSIATRPWLCGRMAERNQKLRMPAVLRPPAVREVRVGRASRNGQDGRAGHSCRSRKSKGVSLRRR